MLLLQKIKCYLLEKKVLEYRDVHPRFCLFVCFLAPFLHAQIVIPLLNFFHFLSKMHETFHSLSQVFIRSYFSFTCLHSIPFCLNEFPHVLFLLQYL
jgi:hypothetical protein